MAQSKAKLLEYGPDSRGQMRNSRPNLLPTPLVGTLLITCLLMIILAACSQPTPEPTKTLSPSPTPSQTPTDTPTPEPTATATITPSPTPLSAQAILSEAVEAAVDAGTVHVEMEGDSKAFASGITFDIPLTSSGDAQWPDSFSQVVEITIGAESFQFSEIRYDGKTYMRLDPESGWDEIVGDVVGLDVSAMTSSGLSNPIRSNVLFMEDLQEVQVEGQETYQGKSVYRLTGKLAPSRLVAVYLQDEAILDVAILVGIEDHLIKSAFVSGEIDGKQTTLFPSDDIDELTVSLDFVVVYSDYGEEVIIDAPPINSTVYYHLNPIGSVVYSPDGSRVAAITADPGVFLWPGDPTDRWETIQLDQYELFSGAVAFSPDAQYLASSGDNSVSIWSVAEEPIQVESLRIEDELYQLASSPGGDTLAGAGLSGVIYVWDTADFTRDPIPLEGHQDVVFSLAYSPDGQHLASAGAEGNLLLWNMAAQASPQILVAEGPSINAVAFHPDGNRLVAADDSGTIWQFDLTGSSPEPILLGRHPDAVVNLDYSQDGRYLVSSDLGGRVRLWELKEEGNRWIELPGPVATINGLSISPDGSFVVASSDAGFLRYWKLDQFYPQLAQAPLVAAGSGECADPLGCVVVPPGEPIQLASALVISGPNADLGLDSQRGVELALDFLGELLGHPLALTPLDDGCNAEGGQLAATTIVADPQIVAMIGTSCSGAAVPAAQIISEAGYVMVSPSNTSPALTDPDLAFYEGYLRTSHNDLLAGVAMAEFAYDELGLTRAAAIHDGDPYTEGLAAAFATTFEELGGEIVAFEKAAANATDVEPLLTRIAATEPELIFYPVFIPLGSLITITARDIEGLEGVVLAASDGVQSPIFLENTIGRSEGLYASGPDLSFINTFYQNEFLPAYREKYGLEPTAPFHTHAFDATLMVLSAIEQVAQVQADGTLLIGRQALRDALYATDGFQGITGTLTCDDFGDCADAHMSISEVQGGEFVRIWP